MPNPVLVASYEVCQSRAAAHRCGCASRTLLPVRLSATAPARDDTRLSWGRGGVHAHRAHRPGSLTDAPHSRLCAPPSQNRHVTSALQQTHTRIFRSDSRIIQRESGLLCAHRITNLPLRAVPLLLTLDPHRSGAHRGARRPRCGMRAFRRWARAARPATVHPARAGGRTSGW